MGNVTLGKLLPSWLLGLAPASDTENTVARTYADVLNLDVAGVSATANFFELGGTSLDVIRLKKQIESVFGIPDIHPIEILKYPTVSSLAKYIDAVKSNSLVAEEYNPIVPLNVTGNKTPIFMVHPGVGDVLIFVNFAKCFHNERPFYALRVRGFEPGHPCFTSVDETVSCYTSAVKRTQPHGPYAIAGYSYGGVIAFEIAKRLEAMGDEVKFIGLIDVPPRIAGRVRTFERTNSVLNLAYLLGLVSREDEYGLVPSFRPLSPKEQLDELWRRSPAGRIDELQLTYEGFDFWVEIAGSTVTCGKSYDPSGSVSAVDVFYAIPPRGTKEDWLKDQLNQWTEFSREEPTFIDVPGNHIDLMSDLNHIPEFKRLFESRLEARGL